MTEDNEAVLETPPSQPTQGWLRAVAQKQSVTQDASEAEQKVADESNQLHHIAEQLRSVAGTGIGNGPA